MSRPQSATRQAQPWLVAIDLQQIFADPASPWASPQYAEAVSGLGRLRPAFGSRFVRTRFVAPARPEGVWVDYYREWPFALVPDGDPLYALTPAISPPGEIVTLPTFGKWGPELAAATHGASRLVLGGVSTDCCVLATALAAADAGIAVTVVADACAGASPADHERALAAMALFAPLVQIRSVAEVLDALDPA